jgi:hypothetical protein
LHGQIIAKASCSGDVVNQLDEQIELRLQAFGEIGGACLGETILVTRERTRNPPRLCGER